MNKDYIIESKGFNEGVGSSVYFEKRALKLEELKRQIAELEKKKKTI